MYQRIDLLTVLGGNAVYANYVANHDFHSGILSEQWFIVLLVNETVVPLVATQRNGHHGPREIGRPSLVQFAL